MQETRVLPWYSYFRCLVRIVGRSLYSVLPFSYLPFFVWWLETVHEAEASRDPPVGRDSQSYWTHRQGHHAINFYEHCSLEHLRSGWTGLRWVAALSRDSLFDDRKWLDAAYGVCPHEHSQRRFTRYTYYYTFSSLKHRLCSSYKSSNTWLCWTRFSTWDRRAKVRKMRSHDCRKRKSRLVGWCPRSHFEPFWTISVG